MNHLVVLNAQAGELEKILSGVKTMLVKEFDPAQTAAHPVSPGDKLYFLRNNDECALRVTATVTRALFLTHDAGEDPSHTLKELQPRLQFTEDQYNTWSARKQALLVEFGCAHKIGVIRIAAHRIADRSDWIAFEEFSQIA